MTSTRTETRISLDEIAGNTAWAIREQDGFVARSFDLSIGPFHRLEQARIALAELLQASSRYTQRCFHGMTSPTSLDKGYSDRYPMFKQSPEYHAVFERHNLPLR
mgnify:CR=1 FL=1